MNKEIKDKWIAALESGAFIQGKEYLENNGAYCCLGVLNRVCSDDGIVIGRCPDGDEYLDAEICEAATGLTFDNQKRLWRMNDTEGKSFAQIAQFIRDTL